MYVLDVFLYVKNRLTSDNVLQPGNPKEKDGRLGIVPVVLHHSNVNAISTIQLNLPHNLKDSENTKNIELMFFELMKRFNYGESLPLLHPIEDMEIEDKSLSELMKAKEKINDKLATYNVKEISSA